MEKESNDNGATEKVIQWTFISDATKFWAKTKKSLCTCSGACGEVKCELANI